MYMTRVTLNPGIPIGEREGWHTAASPLKEPSTGRPEYSKFEILSALFDREHTAIHIRKRSLQVLLQRSTFNKQLDFHG